MTTLERANAGRSLAVCVLGCLCSVVALLVFSLPAGAYAREELQAELESLETEYLALVGDAATRYPLLEWRNELMDMENWYEQDMLEKRTAMDKLEDELSDEDRKAFRRLNILYAHLHLSSYTGDEPEAILALSGAKPDGEEISQEALEQTKRQMEEKLKQVSEELNQLLASTDLPPALLEWAKTHGEHEARRDLLIAALKKLEPREARRLRTRIKRLRYKLDPKRLAEDSAAAEGKSG